MLRDPIKGGYTTPAPALDLTTSLPGDFNTKLNRKFYTQICPLTEPSPLYIRTSSNQKHRKDPRFKHNNTLMNAKIQIQSKLCPPEGLCNRLRKSLNGRHMSNGDAQVLSAGFSRVAHVLDNSTSSGRNAPFEDKDSLNGMDAQARNYRKAARTSCV